MASVDMALEDIIAKNKKNNAFKRGGGGGGKFGGNNRRNGGGGGGRGFQQNRNHSGGARSAPRAPKGYVDHDAVRGNPVVSGGNPNKSVRINLSNLAHTVTSADLEELFEPYDVDTAVVHYNESGVSIGTGDVYLKRKDATRLIKDYEGVALDQQILKMVLVDGAATLASRVQVVKSPGGGIQKRRSSGGGRNENFGRLNNGGGFRRGGAGNRNGSGNNKRRGGEKKVAKTEAELDAELDAYMKKPKSNVVDME